MLSESWISQKVLNNFNYSSNIISSLNGSYGQQVNHLNWAKQKAEWI